QGGQRQRHGHHGGPAPVVTDHEVVPERAERAQPPAHAALPSAVGTAARAAARARRSRATYPSATRAVAGTMASSATSLPGHQPPPPPAPQTPPTGAGMPPPATSSCSPGPRAGGPPRGTRTPAPPPPAAAAPAAASPTFCWLAPNVIAMKTTSRPSSSTPLNESVKAYQSRTPRRPPLAAARAAATWRA